MAKKAVIHLGLLLLLYYCYYDYYDQCLLEKKNINIDIALCYEFVYLIQGLDT